MSATLLAPPPGHNQIAHIAVDLAERGFTVIQDWLPTETTEALAATALAHDAGERTRIAAIGPATNAVIDREQRRARLRWLAGEDPAETGFLRAAEAMRLALNEQLFLGLFDFEACFAVYPPGGFYVRHKDSFAGARNRIVSLVTYLNRDWREADGGALRIYDRTGAPALDVMPRAGLSVLMLSEEIEHEVLPTGALRLAIAGWWRVSQ